MADKTLNKEATHLDETTWGHRWGYRDTRFVVNSDGSVKVTGARYAVSGYDMPGFIPFLEEVLDIKFDLADVKPERADKPVPPPIVNREFVNALAAALPAVRLTGLYKGQTTAWTPLRDLLNSRADDPNFVVEVESDGTAHVRFGDDANGKRPDSGTEFNAVYRVGNGVAGNVGAESVRHIVTNVSAVERVRNPLPAQGGTEPESMETVRRRAPSAFRTQARAVKIPRGRPCLFLRIGRSKKKPAIAWMAGFSCCTWWLFTDSNRGPVDYDSIALTD